ncbi:diguanylate cyclase [Tropicimonas isoalkanivorans]|uniref:diguanylate cyclase n=1 Tax=Tropicimonas isoalkanivorans TaxID=441112 RepID=A0A1I1LKZ2_9RHOB|nr:diguanylate cyclase [Tropicimonas isoalkanivorans]SFC70130.1 response regulator receiver modulated diguanylate cyclase [Tropicimonas isoalkanivorans]
MPGRILVVDDVATNRIVLKVKLTNACYEVLQAGSGEEALRLAVAERPDLILMDMSLPDIDGLDLCRRMKADRRTADIPVIILTAQRDTPAKLAALQAGAEEFLSKPFDDMALLARVRSLLRARSIAAELALREGTCQALGFAEAAGMFLPAGRICLVAESGAEAISWKTRLQERLNDTVELRNREAALNHAEPTPDLFVVTADLGTPGGGLMLLSELRSRPESRHAAIVVLVPPTAQHHAAMALDLGASDVISMPLDMDELELRLKSMLARKRQSDRLRSKLRDGLQMAVTDPLTGLYNRRYALSHLDRICERARETERCFAAMMIDLDAFKAVNDTHGHAAGDAVLKSVADTLQANLRTVDLVARMGGEEFLVVMPDIEPDAAVSAAERLRTAIAETPVDIPPRMGHPLPAQHMQTASIGLIVNGTDPTERAVTVTALLDAADAALYEAKGSGRDRVVLGAVTAPTARPSGGLRSFEIDETPVVASWR